MEKQTIYERGVRKAGSCLHLAAIPQYLNVPRRANTKNLETTSLDQYHFISHVVNPMSTGSL
jgi:hypothetical protein